MFHKAMNAKLLIDKLLHKWISVLCTHFSCFHCHLKCAILSITILYHFIDEMKINVYMCTEHHIDFEHNINFLKVYIIVLQRLQTTLNSKYIFKDAS